MRSFAFARKAILVSLTLAFFGFASQLPTSAQTETSADASEGAAGASAGATDAPDEGDGTAHTPEADAAGEAAREAAEAIPEPPTIAPPVMMAPIRSAGDPLPQLNAAPSAGGPALSAVDIDLFRQAHAAADRNDWNAARTFAARGSDPIAKLTVEWRYLLDEKSGAGFDAISNFVYQHPNWPRRDQLLARAEKVMPSDLEAPHVVAWYGTRKPVSTEGEVRLAGALIALGKNNEGAALIRQAWIDGPLTQTQEAQIRQTYGSLLTLDDHRARLERVLSTEGIVEGNRLMQFVDADTQRVARARLNLRVNPTLAANASSQDAAVANDPRYMFDYARALRRFGRDEDAWAAMALVPPSPLLDPNKVWVERHIMARDALKARRSDVAYGLVSKNNLERGANFADAEFLSGWIALRQLNNPEGALNHFQRMAGAVSLPISRARAQYWIGRSLEALGRDPDAAAAYRRAGTDSGTYYGQLALARLDIAPKINVIGTLPDIGTVRPAFVQDERVRAMRVFADLGQKYLLRIFAMSIAAESETPGYFGLLADFMANAGDRATALRIAKLASYKNVLLVPHFVPLVDLPRVPGGISVEPALVLGLTRQESEFDPEAISTAGARGLMQLMPGTARATARQVGLAYNANRLVDPTYNMQLGIAHLSDLLKAWEGSYILVIAAYNAGSGNVRDWIATFGDPRDGNLDPIDWVELIPFGETRNYVQRVLENTNVYRNRIAGREERLQIVADLYRPNAPANEIVTAAETAAPATP